MLYHQSTLFTMTIARSKGAIILAILALLFFIRPILSAAKELGSTEEPDHSVVDDAMSFLTTAPHFKFLSYTVQIQKKELYNKESSWRNSLQTDAVVTLSLFPPWRFKIVVNKEVTDALMRSRIVYGEIGQKRIVKLNTASGNLGEKMQSMKYAEIFDEESGILGEDAIACAFWLFIPNYNGIFWPPEILLKADLNTVKRLNNGSIWLPIYRKYLASAGEERSFLKNWKILDQNGLCVKEWGEITPPTSQNDQTYFEASAKGDNYRLIGGIKLPANFVQSQRHGMVCWVERKVNITNVTFSNEIDANEFKPRLEKGWFVEDHRTGLRFKVGATPTEVVKEIEKAIREDDANK